ncbi:MAG: hypothetical protein RR162_00155 [Oscillospiraceae bacterium]
MHKNSEGYADPTAGEAISTIRREERKAETEKIATVSSLVYVVKQVVALAGFELGGRIVLIDKETGKEYR